MTMTKECFFKEKQGKEVEEEVVVVVVVVVVVDTKDRDG
jgi:hypothetical protein